MKIDIIVKFIVFINLFINLVKCEKVSFQLLETFKIKGQDAQQAQTKTLFIKDFYMLIVVSQGQLIAYDMKYLSTIATINLDLQSEIKGINYLTSSNLLYIIIQISNTELKYFNFYTFDQPYYDTTQTNAYPIIYTNLKVSNIIRNSVIDNREKNELNSNTEYILESHRQVQPSQRLIISVAVLEINSTTKTIEKICLINTSNIISREKELQLLQCQSINQVQMELQSQMKIEFPYQFQRIDEDNYILLFANFKIITLNYYDQNIKYIDLTERYNLMYQVNKLIPKQEIFKQFQQLKLINTGNQDIYILYQSIEKEYYIIQFSYQDQYIKNIQNIYNIPKHQLFQQGENGFDKLENKQFYRQVNVDVLYFSQNIVIQYGQQYIIIKSDYYTKPQQIQQQEIFEIENIYTNTNIFKSQTYMFEISQQSSKDQDFQFILSRNHQKKNYSYQLHIQNCKQQEKETNVYYAYEFACKKKECPSYLLYCNNKQITEKSICMNLEGEQKGIKNKFPIEYKIILGIVAVIVSFKIFSKMKCCYFRIIKKLKQIRVKFKKDTDRLLKDKTKDIYQSKNEETNELENKQTDIELTSKESNENQENYTIEQLQTNNFEIKLTDSNNKRQDLNNNEKNINGNQQKYERNHRQQNHTPMPDDINDKQGMKNSYYNDSKFYSQKVKEQNEEDERKKKIKQIKKQKEEQINLYYENKELKNEINKYQSKSAHNIQDSDGFDYQQNYNQNQNIQQNNNYIQNMQYNQYNSNQHKNQYLSNNTPQDDFNDQNNNDQSENAYSIYINNNQNYNQNDSNQYNNQQIVYQKEIMNDKQSNNVNQQQLENQQNKQGEDQENENQFSNSQLQITQQLNFFKWALDQQFGFDQLNQNQQEQGKYFFPYILGQSLIKSENSESTGNDPEKENTQSHFLSCQLQESHSDFKKILSEQLGSSQVSDQRLILSHSQIEKLSQSLCSQFDSFKKSQVNINQNDINQVNILQQFIQEQLQSEMKVDENMLQNLSDPKDGLSQNNINNPQVILISNDEPQQSEISQGDIKLCSICYTNDKNCALYKCGHTYCFPCADLIFKQKSKCPYCQQDILDLIKLYG